MLINRYILAISLLPVLALGTHAWAADGDLQAEHAWIREAPPGSRVHAGYLTLTNHGKHDLGIDAVSSPDFGAAEIHLSRTENGVASMVPVNELMVPAGETVKLEPGSYHLMLFRAVRELHQGDSVTLHLHEASGNCIDVTAPVLRDPDTEHQH